MRRRSPDSHTDGDAASGCHPYADACAPDANPHGERHRLASGRSLAGRERWEHAGIADYDYIGAWVCFCPEEYLADTQVTVRDGKCHRRGSR